MDRYIGKRRTNWRAPLQAAVRALSVELEAERDRKALWLPVFMGCGVAAFFALPFDPSFSVLAIFLVLAGGTVWVAQWRRWPFAGGMATVLLTAAIGMALAAWHADRASAPVLERAKVFHMLSGRVVDVEPFADGARVRLDRLDFGRRVASPPLKLVRIKLQAGAVPKAGSRIAVSARLSPPPRPSYPGAYDFARMAWFDGLGAVGFALSEWRGLPSRAPPTVMDRAVIALSAIRGGMGERIREILPSVSGAIAVALLTGDRSGVPESDLEALRLSGLAHLLAISGLHIGMVAFTAFGAVRVGLALWEPWARDWPIKKIAAVAALIIAFAYMLLAGATVPTQRAFLMTGIVLLAVLTDRKAISMRLVAVAAGIVITVSPQALVGASFQLSFAAVIALVAVYESYRLGRGANGARSGLRRVGLYFAAVALTTVVAGAATAPFAVHHFGRMAHYSVLANLAAVPIVTFLVMPMELLAALLMPVGLDGLPLRLAGWGIDAVLWIARAVAALPGAEGRWRPMPAWGLAAVVLGGIWAAIWRRHWRWLGAPVVLIGIASPLATRVPALILHDSGTQGAIIWNKSLWVERARRDRFAQRVWQEKTALLIAGDWSDLMRQPGSPLACGPVGCILQTSSGAIALVRDQRGVPEDCRQAAAVRSPVQPHPAICRDTIVFGPADLRHAGTTVLYDDGGRLRVETVSDRRGARMWAR